MLSFVRHTVKRRKNLCTEHAIKVNALEQIVLADIRKVCRYVRQYEEEFVDDFRKCSRKESARLQSSARNELKKDGEQTFGNRENYRKTL